MNITLENVAIDSRRGLAVLSQAAAVARAWCLRAGRAVWRGLEAYGERRAMLELQRLGYRFEQRDPELAEQAREAARSIASR